MSEPSLEQLSPTEPLPWEEPSRQKLPALVETVKLVLLQPREAFRRMNRELPASRALLFALAVAWPSVTLGFLVALLLQLGELAVASAFFKETFGPDLTQPFLWGVPVLLIFSGLVVLLPPIFLVLSLAVNSLMFHLFLLLFGAGTRGLGTTFRVLAYSQATAIFYVVPVAGGLVAFFWQLLVTILGLAAAHGASETRTAWAVLTPFLLACACLVLGILFLAGSAVVNALGGP